MAKGMYFSHRLPRLAALLGCLCLVGTALADVRVEVDVATGATIAGETKFTVLVRSDELVTSVEFYVGDDLRDSDESTPYEFVLDTIAEDEGPIQVRFLAFTDKGTRAEKKLSLIIDNGIAKGVDFHVARGEELLTDSQWDDALDAGRVALKCKAGHSGALALMARAYFGKGVLASAQKFAEDAVDADPENADAQNLLAGIQLQRSFATFTRGGEKDDTLAIIKQALTKAVETRQRVLQSRLDRFTPTTDENERQYVDAALDAARYALAIRQLDRMFRRNTADAAVANRYVYALARAGRFREALATSEINEKAGGIDATGWALKAVLLEMRGQTDAALQAEREASLAGGSSLAVQSARAFLALLRGRSPVLAEIAKSMAEQAGANSEVLFYDSVVNFQLGEIEASRRSFEQGMLAEPTNYDLLIERANQSISVAARSGISDEDQMYQLKVAGTMLEAALVAKPESFEALTGLSLVRLFENKFREAATLAEAAIRAGAEYAAAQYALAAALNRLDDPARASRAVVAAGKLDAANLDGASIPTPLVAWQYYRRWGRVPLLPLPLP